MRSGIIRRIKLLERRVREETQFAKKAVPERLTQYWEDQGIPCDLRGLPDWDAVARIESEQNSARESTSAIPNPGVE